MGIGRHAVPGRAVGYDIAVAALAVVALVAILAVSPWRPPPWWLWLTVPVVVLMSRSPVVLLRPQSGIEVGLDPSVLIFLAFVGDRSATAVLWSVAAVVSQFSMPKASWTRLFNAGVTMLAGLAATLAVQGLATAAPHDAWDLLAVLAGAGVYFAVDYVASAIGVALLGRSTFRRCLWDGNAITAFGCFAAVAALGYLAAVVCRHEWWAVSLMVAPMLALVLASRAFARTTADRARVRTLFAAARQAQTAQTVEEIVDLVTTEGQRLLRCPAVRLAAEPGDPRDLSVPVPGAPASQGWLIAGMRVTGEVFQHHERDALDMLAAVAGESMQRAALVAELAQTARHDALTGLPNRSVFRERVEQALRRRQARIVVLFCDLDRFKSINDTYGHEAGDALLKTVGGRLARGVRPTDLVARLGGDEFAVLLEDATDEEAERVAQRLLAACREPYHVGGRPADVYCSIGLAVVERGDAATDAGALLQNADLAMYRAKAAGKNRLTRFSTSMRSEEVHRLTLIEELRGAAARGELVVHYQPIVDFPLGTVDGFEALVRWNSPTRGLLYPDAFIPLIEGFDLLAEVDAEVLRQALRDGKRLSAAAGRQVTIGVNASPREIEEGILLRQIRTGSTDEVQLVLEITESTLAQPAVIPVLEELRARGVRILMDDFGTGYSSIATLRRLPVNGIKLDRAFVADVASDARDAGVVRAVIEMAAALDLVLVAEGIETGAQLAALRALGCTLGQGFHLARPMPIDDAVAYLERHRAVAPAAVA